MANDQKTAEQYDPKKHAISELACQTNSLRAIAATVKKIYTLLFIWMIAFPAIAFLIYLFVKWPD